MGSPQNVQLRVGNTFNAAPKTTSFLDYLQESLKGGTPTYDFFAGDFGALQELASAASKGGHSAWTTAPKASTLGYSFLDPSQPAAVLKGSKGAIVVQFHGSASALGEHTTSYKQAGVATTYLVTGPGTVDVIVSYVEKLGPPIAGIALGPAIMVVLKAVKNFLQGFVSKAFGLAEEGGAEAEAIGEEAASDAAEEAAVDGEIIADELAVSVEFGPLAIVGIAVAAITLIVSVILFFLSKTMTCFVRVYNFTSHEITLSICSQHDLEIKQQPKTGKVPPPGTPPAPPGVTALDKVIYRADYTFLNSDDLKGLGFVIQAGGNPKSATAFPGFTAMADVPAVGDNSLYISLDGTLDCGEIYDHFSGTYKVLTKSTCWGQFRAYIATNQVSGKSDSPVTGKSGWFYEYLLVVEEQDLFMQS